MTTIHTSVQNGRTNVAALDGTEVVAEIACAAKNDSPEADIFTDSPDSITARVEAVNQLEPLIFGEGEEAKIQAEREERRINDSTEEDPL